LAANNPVLCALCGVSPATTEEHVPAECMFPKPRPGNRITVPACWPCNNGSSEDDEYLRAALALIDEEAPSEALEKLRPVVRRGLWRVEAARLWKHFSDRMQLDEPQNPRIKIDQERMRSIARKHFQGLFYHLQGAPLPPVYRIEVMPWTWLRSAPPEDRQHWDLVRIRALTGRSETIGADVFTYHFTNAYAHRHVYFARVVYYGNFEYLAHYADMRRQPAPNAA
jgi:hypothetical protein